MKLFNSINLFKKKNNLSFLSDNSITDFETVNQEKINNILLKLECLNIKNKEYKEYLDKKVKEFRIRLSSIIDEYQNNQKNDNKILEYNNCRTKYLLELSTLADEVALFNCPFAYLFELQDFDLENVNNENIVEKKEELIDIINKFLNSLNSTQLNIVFKSYGIDEINFKKLIFEELEILVFNMLVKEIKLNASKDLFCQLPKEIKLRIDNLFLKKLKEDYYYLKFIAKDELFEKLFFDYDKLTSYVKYLDQKSKLLAGEINNKDEDDDIDTYDLSNSIRNKEKIYLESFKNKIEEFWNKFDSDLKWTDASVDNEGFYIETRDEEFFLSRREEYSGDINSFGFSSSKCDLEINNLKIVSYNEYDSGMYPRKVFYLLSFNNAYDYDIIGWIECLVFDKSRFFSKSRMLSLVFNKYELLLSLLEKSYESLKHRNIFLYESYTEVVYEIFELMCIVGYKENSVKIKMLEDNK